MENTPKRLHEEELVNEMAPVAPVQPAEPAEVAAAQPVVVEEPVVETIIEEPVVEEIPQPTAEEPIISTPQEPITPVDPLTPPAPGMIPSGWIRPEDLAAAIAQQTGDMEAASVAEDATITEEPIPTESAIEQSVEPVVETVVEEAPVVEAPVVEETVVLESISQEELDVIREYRLYKALKESEEKLPGEIESADYEAYKLAADEMHDIEKEPVSLNLHEAEEDVEVSEEEAESDEAEDIKPEDDAEAEEASEEVEEEEGELVDIFELLNDTELPEGFNYDDVEDEDILASVSEFLADFDDLEASSEIPEVLRTVADFIEDVADVVEADVEDAPVEEDVEAAPSVEDDTEESEVDPIAEDEEEIDFEEEEEDFEEASHYVRRVECKVSRKDRLTEEVVYPAGSYPTNSEWPSADSNLIRSYEKAQARRREALKSYRENSVNKPSENFSKALNSSVKISEKASVDTNSWSANKFFDKYKESREFSFNDLLRDGFLG